MTDTYQTTYAYKEKGKDHWHSNIGNACFARFDYSYSEEAYYPIICKTNEGQLTPKYDGERKDYNSLDTVKQYLPAYLGESNTFWSKTKDGKNKWDLTFEDYIRYIEILQKDFLLPFTYDVIDAESGRIGFHITEIKNRSVTLGVFTLLRYCMECEALIKEFLYLVDKYPKFDNKYFLLLIAHHTATEPSSRAYYYKSDGHCLFGNTRLPSKRSRYVYNYLDICFLQQVKEFNQVNYLWASEDVCPSGRYDNVDEMIKEVKKYGS